ncbi:MAG: asparaginase [Bacillota bacterium]|nr:asparaginase [Bacillota bacterium]
MKTIAIIATGGTIAGTGQNGKTVGYHAGEISVDDILQSIPGIHEVSRIRTFQLCNLDSNEMNKEIWMQLSNTINSLVLDEDIDGIVVTHGTDLIEETSYYLTLTLNTNKPVVITGAMRPDTATSADGPFNLYQAVNLACSDKARGKGVMVLFSNTIFSGRDVQKVNNFKIDAFGQKASGCLGYMQDEEVYFFSESFKKHTSNSVFAGNYTTLPDVGIAYFYGGVDSSILYHLAEKNEGIVLVGSGSGNYSQAWLNAINDLSEKGIVFVRSSRVSEGIVFSDKVFDPNEYCVASNTLSGQKARILLMLALKKTKNREDIKRIFNEY